MRFGLSKIIVALGLLFFFVTAGYSQFCNEPGSIRKVKNRSAGWVEYVIFDVIRPPNPTYSVTTESPPFTEDPTGDPISVSGDKFKVITFTGVVWTCQIREQFSLPRTAIKDIKSITQFEGIVGYVVGYRARSRYVTTYYYDVGPIRKVVMKFKK